MRCQVKHLHLNFQILKIIYIKFIHVGGQMLITACYSNTTSQLRQVYLIFLCKSCKAADSFQLSRARSSTPKMQPPSLFCSSLEFYILSKFSWAIVVSQICSCFLLSTRVSEKLPIIEADHFPFWPAENFSGCDLLAYKWLHSIE